ncbi:MAG TPA: TetR/AcrR family transcriptional regulator [Iamia sp.]
MARRSALMGAAMGIVARDGIPGLTMQAVADRVGCSVGTVYTHFSSKGVLIADLQDVSVQRIIRSFVAVRARSHELAVEHGATDRDRASADLVLFGEFFIASWDAFPEESHMLFSVLSERGEIVPRPELDRVLGSTLTLLGLGQEVVQGAIDTEVITDGPVADRVIMGAAALLGVLLISHLGHLDQDAFDHCRLTRATWHDLLRGWGMGPADMAWGIAHVARLADTGPIAPDPD